MKVTDPTARSRDVVESVIAVATSMFAEQGYEGTSMRDVSEATGISVAVIYHHFGSKESLFNELCDYKYDSFVDAIARHRRRQAGADCPPEELAIIFFDVLTGDPELFFLLQRDMISPKASADRFKSRRHYWRLRELIDSTLGLSPDNEHQAAMSFAFAALIQGTCELALATNTFEGKQRERYFAEQRRYLRHFVVQAFAPERFCGNSAFRKGTGEQPVANTD